MTPSQYPSGKGWRGYDANPDPVISPEEARALGYSWGCSSVQTKGTARAREALRVQHAWRGKHWRRGFRAAIEEAEAAQDLEAALRAWRPRARGKPRVQTQPLTAPEARGAGYVAGRASVDLHGPERARAELQADHAARDLHWRDGFAMAIQDYEAAEAEAEAAEDLQRVTRVHGARAAVVLVGGPE